MHWTTSSMRPGALNRRVLGCRLSTVSIDCMEITQAAKPRLHSPGNSAMVSNHLQWQPLHIVSPAVCERVSAALHG